MANVLVGLLVRSCVCVVGPLASFTIGHVAILVLPLLLKVRTIVRRKMTIPRNASIYRCSRCTHTHSLTHVRSYPTRRAVARTGHCVSTLCSIEKMPRAILSKNLVWRQGKKDNTDILFGVEKKSLANKQQERLLSLFHQSLL